MAAAILTGGMRTGGAKRRTVRWKLSTIIGPVGRQMLQCAIQLPTVHAGAYAMGFECGHHITGGDVSAGSRGVWTAAQASGTGIHGPDAVRPCGQHVFNASTVGVVEVHGNAVGRQPWNQQVQQPTDFIRRRLADGVGNGHFGNTDVHELFDHPNNSYGGNFAFKGTPEGRGDIPPDGQSGFSGSGRYRAESLQGAGNGGVDVFFG